MRRQRRPGRAFKWGLVPAAILAIAVHALPARADECAEITAYSSKLKKAQRERLIREAREQAVQELAKRAWSVAVGSEIEERYRRVTGRSDDPGRQQFLEDIRIQENLVIVYNVPELLRGGDFSVKREGKKQATVRYCVVERVFEEARGLLVERRREAVEGMRDRLSDIERRIRNGELRIAARSLATAKTEVQAQAMHYEDYTSAIDGRRQSFFAWLSEWSEEVEAGRDYAAYLTRKAEGLMEEGHLAQASQYLDQALAADPYNVPAHLKKDEIEARREKRAALLRRAIVLAEVGRFSAAKGKVKEAERIDSDDRVALENTRTTIQGLKAQYEVYNPRVSAALFLGVGSLGADAGEIESRINAATGENYAGLPPISFGLDVNARIGRHFVYSLGGAYGFSSDDNDSQGSSEELFGLLQATTGLGFRTVRRADRKFVFKAIVGAAWEQVDLNLPSGSPYEDSDSQTGGFARFAFEWPSVVIFLQHGFGFENDEEEVDSLAVWNDSFQLGLGVVF